MVHRRAFTFPIDGAMTQRGLLALTTAALLALATVRTITAPSVAEHPALAQLASRWEPELYAELGAVGPALFDPTLRTPCVADKGGLVRCVPGAFLIGNWQSNSKGLGAAIGAHPDIMGVGNDRCFQTWTDDKGGRRWLRQTAPAGFDARRQLLAALGCVTMLTFYPGFAGRFHKFWEKEYWPCKAKCVREKACEKTYYQREMWPCKQAALAAHDRAALLPTTASTPALNVTPPYLLRAFYGARVKLVACVRSPIDRLRHAFYTHPHYAKKYGQGAAGLHAYAMEQRAGWQACVQSYGARRCAIHFEQLGAAQDGVFFHADQLIRGMYAPFVADFLGAFPESQLLVVRTEDFIDKRQPLLNRIWRHLGVEPLDFENGSVPPALVRVQRRLPTDYWTWTKHKGPILPETTLVLKELYRPFNQELREMLAKEGTSCRGAAGDALAMNDAPPCDVFLWEPEVD